jgi:hypothetical protein
VPLDSCSWAVNVNSLPQSSYPSSPPKDQDLTLTGLHQEAIVMTSRQLFVYRSNSVYVWDGTSGSHDARGPVSIASKSTTISEPDRTWLGTGNMRSNSVHEHFPLSDNPLVFEFSLTGLPSLAKTRGQDKSASIIHPTNLLPFCSGP